MTQPKKRHDSEEQIVLENGIIESFNGRMRDECWNEVFRKWLGNGVISVVMVQIAGVWGWPR